MKKPLSTGFEGKDGRLLRYLGPGGAVEVPEGFRSLERTAFAGRDDIHTIRLPGSVRTLGPQSISDCGGLRRLILPADIPAIAPDAIQGCPNLEAVEVDSPFGRAVLVHGVVLADGMRTARFGVPGLEQIRDLPETLEVIGQEAFAGQKSLVCVELPDSVHMLDRLSFQNCTGLRTLKLPAGLKTIAERAFAGCSSLKSVTFPPGVTEIGWCAFQGSGLRRLTIPEGVQNVGRLAFEDCPLEEVRMPVHLSIYSDAFHNCCPTRVILTEQPGAEWKGFVWDRIPMGFWNGVTSLWVESVLPRSMPVWLRKKAWRGALEQKLAGKSLPGDWEKELEAYAGRQRKTLWQDRQYLQYILQKKLIRKQEIGDYVEMAAGLADGEITASLLEYQRRMISPEEMQKQEEKKLRREMRALETGQLLVRDIRKSWKYAARNDGTVRLNGYQGSGVMVAVPGQVGKRPVSVLGESALSPSHCFLDEYGRRMREQITWVVLPEGIRSVEGRAFRDCRNLTGVELPSSLTELGRAVFQGCSALESIRIPAGVKCIPDRTFAGCGALRQVELPDTVEKIGVEAFQGCRSLENLRLPAGLRHISMRTCSGCENLSAVEFPPELKSIGVQAFSGCCSLRTVVLPPQVQEIMHGAFRKSGLVRVTIPEGVTEVSGSCFAGCTDLQEVKLPSTLKTIREGAFRGCCRLEKIVLPQGVLSIGNEAFCSCTALEEVAVPEGCRELGWNAFGDCANLRVLTLPGSLEMTDTAFLQIDPDITIRAPAGSCVLEYAKDRFMKYECLDEGRGV